MVAQGTCESRAPVTHPAHMRTKQTDRAPQVLVTWDFAQRPKRLFYELLRAEFSDVRTIQRSVVIAPDAFTARRLCALAEWYGAHVVAFALAGETLADVETENDAREFIARVHAARLKRRGQRT